MTAVEDTLKINVKPAEVRLKYERNPPFIWHIADSNIEHLFQRQLSKHSTGAYIQLYNEVGKSFWAEQAPIEVYDWAN